MLAYKNEDIFWMKKALKLAENVLYLTAPNPRVGCLIVKDNQCIGEGATQVVGGDHAEICAIRAVHQLKDIEDSTIYITLEPCSHSGRTPPCVNSLLSVRPKRVVIAMVDPNPSIRGKGINQLRKAGISVTVGVCSDEALQMNIGFAARMIRGIPWIWMKVASSLDGRGALYNGTSKWITSCDAREDGHHWRARSCVILTGIGTILQDDPLLDVRNKVTRRFPIKAILDPSFQIPENAKILDGNQILLFTGRIDQCKAARMLNNNVKVITLPCKADRIDIASLMTWFSNNQINEVHVETGPTLAGELILGGYIDEMIIYLAPMLIGEAQPIARLPVLENLNNALRFEFFHLAKLKNDLRLRARSFEKWNFLRNTVNSFI